MDDEQSGSCLNCFRRKDKTIDLARNKMKVHRSKDELEYATNWVREFTYAY